MPVMVASQISSQSIKWWNMAAISAALCLPLIIVTAGGPGGATDSVTSFIVREYRDRSNVGYGTLLSFVYLIFIVILMTILIRFVNRWLQRAS